MTIQPLTDPPLPPKPGPPQGPPPAGDPPLVPPPHPGPGGDPGAPAGDPPVPPIVEARRQKTRSRATYPFTERAPGRVLARPTPRSTRTVVNQPNPGRSPAMPRPVRA